ncbi:MAG: ribosomal protection-like ABC-F family protein [Acutalibacteraceae bacterium]
MAMITVGNLCMDFGGDVLFNNMNFEVQDGDRIGLIGVNGSGKTTLFKILTGAISPSSGMVAIQKNTKIGYMEQHVCRHLERSAYDEVLSVFAEILDMELEIDTLTRQIENGTHDNLNAMIERQSFLTDEFQRLGGLTCRARARSALLGLGFIDSEMNLPIRALSGGQRAKLQLAKLLLSDANLLLLDEPTNHLDTQAVEWLEDYLISSHAAYIVISHDRYFLDKTTKRTFEIENQKLVAYKGNYSAYLPQRAEHRLAQQRSYDNTVKEIARLEGVVEQQRRWNREKNIKTAESKLKMIDRLEKTLERPDRDAESMHFKLGVKSMSGEDVLKINKLSMGFSGKMLFQDISFEVHRGERIFVLGPNGCGKTSFLKILMKQYLPTSGNITFGEGITVGYYDQIQQGMDSDKTIFDELSDKFPTMTNTEIRSLLARFLFKGDDVFKSVGLLSGGEKARILLSELMLKGANLLLLDEPTNHLDIDSCEVLQNALKEYEGTLIVVSHDRYLINALADKILYLTPQGVQIFEGSYDAFLAAVDPFKKNVPSKTTEPTEKQSEYKNKKERDAKRRKAKAQLGKCEQEIADTEAQIEAYNEQLSSPEVASDYVRISELTALLEDTQKLLETLYERWEELSLACEE